jgi:hypothetical protein
MGTLEEGLKLALGYGSLRRKHRNEPHGFAMSDILLRRAWGGKTKAYPYL